MKKGNVFVGKINITSNNLSYVKESNSYEVYQKMFLLLKLRDNCYANLEWMSGPKEYFQLLTYISGMSDAPGFILGTMPTKEKDYYVDVDTLCNFYSESEYNKNVSVLEAKNDWLLDSRIPVGCAINETGMVVYKKKFMPIKK